MALLIEGLPCSICGKPYSPKNEDVISTPHFIHDEQHHLWRFSDSGMHRTCFITWKHRDEFRNLFNDASEKLYANTLTKRQMMDDGSIIAV